MEYLRQPQTAWNSSAGIRNSIEFRRRGIYSTQFVEGKRFNEKNRGKFRFWKKVKWEKKEEEVKKEKEKYREKKEGNKEKRKVGKIEKFCDTELIEVLNRTVDQRQQADQLAESLEAEGGDEGGGVEQDNVGAVDQDPGQRSPPPTQV